MQKKVLDSLYKQGGLTFFAFPGENKVPLESVRKLALALNAGASFVEQEHAKVKYIVIDFSGKLGFDRRDYFTAQDLISYIIGDKEFSKAAASNAKGWLIGGKDAMPTNDVEFRNLYRNLQLFKKACPHIIGILPSDINEIEAHYVSHLARLLVIASRKKETAASYLEHAPSLHKLPLLWKLREAPDKNRYPAAYKAVTKSDSFSSEIRQTSWHRDTKKFARIIATLHRIQILEKNPLDGVTKIFRSFYPLFIVIAILLPFLWVTNMDAGISNQRDRLKERDKIAVAPSFEYTFNGQESLHRICRYAIGRFNAILTNDKILSRYISETLKENSIDATPWTKDGIITPPAGTVIKFTRPDYLDRESAESESIGAAWKYWTSIFSDSVAYITEFYHEKETSVNRKHTAIDVAAKQGTRILAPFTAKAWTKTDERGGTIMGLVSEKKVILFMHCDQLLYLDGQDVMAGDPIATVGMTGHTTGPHAHIVTGIVEKNGPKQLGNVRYRIVDPIQWFYRFKPNSPKN